MIPTEDLDFKKYYGKQYCFEVEDLRKKRKSTFVTYDIQFYLNSDKFASKRSVYAINKITSFAKNNPKIKLEIGYHHGHQPSLLQSTNIGDERLEIIRKHFNQKGIDTNRITYTNYNFDHPKVTCNNCTREEFMLNQRFEIKKMQVSLGATK
jgi:hypothetical protein